MSFISLLSMCDVNSDIVCGGSSVVRGLQVNFSFTKMIRYYETLVMKFTDCNKRWGC